MAVGVTNGSGLSFDKPMALFDLPWAHSPGLVPPIDVSADRQRFIIVAPRGGARTAWLTVAVNWMADLKPTRPQRAAAV